MRWKRWAAGGAAAVTLYTLAGGWLLPHLIKSQLPKFVETELARKASIGAVSFNPFTLRLEARDVVLTEADGAPLFGVAGLAVELNWRSLFKRAWSVAEIRITAPRLQLAIAPDGKFNIAEFIATLNKRPHDDDSGGMPRLVIGEFTLEQGEVAMHDRHAGYNDTYAPIAFTLHHLSTLPDENGDYTLSADAGLGGKLRWKGTAALNPIAGGGELVLDNVALPGMAAYLKSAVAASVTSGRLSATLPYRFAYADGKLDASLAGAALALRDLAVVRQGAAAPFLALKLLDVSGVAVDLAKRSVTVDGLRLNEGKVMARRDARGEIDLANLMVAAPASAAAAAPAAPAAAAPAPAAREGNWKLQVKQLAVDDIAADFADETVRPALKVSADKMRLHLGLQAETVAGGLKLALSDAEFSLANLALNSALRSGAQAPFRLAELGFSGGTLDLAARRASVGRVYANGGQLDLSRDAQGRFVLLNSLPTSSAPASPAKPAAPAAAPWNASVGSIELDRFGAHYDDAGNGIKLNLQDFKLKLDGVSSDARHAIKFKAGLAVREGGQLSAKGSFLPSTGAVDTELSVQKLALAPVQPLLAKYLKLKIAGGGISGQGSLRTSGSGSGAGGPKNPAFKYEGSFEVAGLALNEEDNDRFAAWKSLRAEKLSLSLGPDMLDIAELRVVEPDATLIIENDRSFNAARLLVQPAAASGAPAAGASPAAVATPAATAAVSTGTVAQPAPAGPAFPVRVRRVRLQNAKLNFTDLSLRPQFSARIVDLNGIITGLSSRQDARSQIELDGRVDEYGLARVRGELNPFAPADNTDLNVIFKNVDMVSASPYSMKFAGYKIAEGKISLDLQYKVRQHRLEGNNQIVLDKLTLGERIDSPDALKLPLELALAILKDSDGRIDLGLPVAGDMNDPQFSYGAVVWKAFGNVMGKIISSPFRALGNLLGISGDKLESIAFDAGSDVVLPPEREKLQQVARMLAKKAQLKLAVPGAYSQAADGAALRGLAVRQLVALRAGIKLAPGEQPGPLDIGQRAVRGALRDLYAERFGAAELDKQKKAAEGAGTGTAPASDAVAAQAQQKLPMLQRLGKLVQGEPQVADATAFYGTLRQRLEQNQPLPADALPQLGARRAAAVVAVLAEAGAAQGSVHAGAAAAADVVDGDVTQSVALKLGLSAK